MALSCVWLMRSKNWDRLLITLDLDQQRPAHQKRLDQVAVDILNAHLLEPAGLHNAGDAGSIVAVALIDLHLEHSLRNDARRCRSPAGQAA